jgi:hypothetical protein
VGLGVPGSYNHPNGVASAWCHNDTHYRCILAAQLTRSKSAIFLTQNEMALILVAIICKQAKMLIQCTSGALVG